MEQVIYGDVYWAVNFTMDYLALWLTAKAARLPVNPWRTALAAGMGAVYALAALFLPDGNVLSALTAFAVPILLVAIALPGGGLGPLLVRVAMFYGLSLLLGGGITAVRYAVGRWAGQEITIGGQVETLPADLPYWGVLLAGLLISALLLALLRRRQKLPAAVEIAIGEEGAPLYRMQALVDSGNLLTEPLSGRLVIVVDRRFADFLPTELACLAHPELSPIPTPRLRIIPYATAGGEGILYGYLPGVVTVGGKPRSACVALADLPPGEGRLPAVLPAGLL